MTVDAHEPAPTAVADSAAADSVVNGGALVVTQADRDAAASVAVLVEMRELIRAGRADHHAEPFARHREQAERETTSRIVAMLREQDGYGEWYEAAAAIERGEV